MISLDRTAWRLVLEVAQHQLVLPANNSTIAGCFYAIRLKIFTDHSFVPLGNEEGILKEVREYELAGHKCDRLCQ